MAAPVIKVVFTDGHSEDVTLNMRVIVDVERKFGKDAPPVESTLYGVWLRLGRHGNFEDFLDAIESVDMPDGEPTPTQPEPPEGS